MLSLSSIPSMRQFEFARGTTSAATADHASDARTHGRLRAGLCQPFALLKKVRGMAEDQGDYIVAVSLPT